MVESSSPDITPKEEPVTLDRPKSPNLFLLATQVEFTFDEIMFTTNNEVEVADGSDHSVLREKIVPYPRFISLLLEHMAPKYDNEELTINLTQVFSVHNEILKPNQPEEPPFTDHMKAICNLDVPVDSKAPKYSSPTEEETKSSLAMDTSPSHPSPPTPVVGEMHKEAQQATGGLTSLGDTSKDGAHPQLSSDGLETAHTISSAYEESGADDISQKVKLEDLSDILKDTSSTFFTPDSLIDEQIIISNTNKEEENAKNDKDTEDTSSQKDELEQAKVKAEAEVASMKAKPSYPNINQLTELLVTSLKPELSELVASHNFASFLPTELKELSSKILGLSREIKELKQHIKDMEIKLPGDLIKMPTKLESFTSTISSLSSQVAELKNIQWKPPAEFLNLPSQVSPIQENLKTLDSLPNLLHKVSDTLNRFSTVMENALGAASMNVPSAGQAPLSPAEGEKNTKDASTNLKNELIDLLGKDVVTQYYTKKLLFDKYYDKILKRKKNPKITNCEVLTKKGPITLKIYREDGSEEVISNLKVMKTREDQLTQTEQELKIGLNQPFKEQDPLDELTDLANKKRKRTGDTTDHSKSSKKHNNVMKVGKNGYQFMLFNLYQLFTQAEVVQFEMLKFLQHQLFRSLEDWEVSSLQCMQRGCVLDESSQSSESSVGVSCNTCGSNVHSTTDHNDFEYFKIGEKIQATKAREPTRSGCSRSITSVKSYLHKYVEKPSPKVVFGDNSSCITEGYGLINYGGIVFSKLKGRIELIEAARTMMNGSVVSKHFWTEALRISCYTQNRLIIVKRHDKTPYEIFRERIPDINYFHVFGCPMFIHNNKDYLGKFDAKADDGYLLGYSFVSKAFKVFNTRIKQIKESYHVTYDESIEAIMFTNNSVDETGIDDSSRYPPNEFLHEDDPFRQY
ncbi:retrovirus-related pol polyprotein from transposon TNT 1-94 [Tanacetum coccineum]|uniref:Retrovirus-related pol polyprotein from transposon TNT 1-94 n=1 Tax=Tanacetum coccineum TaxID=301880 RepID=A0ABQ5C461_9ASTR